MKLALVAFEGEPMCFVHVLINALDAQQRGIEVAVVIEGAATALVRTFHEEPTAPFAAQYRKVKEAGLIMGVCKACAAKMGALEASQTEGLSLLGEASGHPSLARLAMEGYQVITF
ncbi:MAG: DsrE family protein [Myxococcota bacterium]|nr:DsrE family protein [Myxococcota bacterium]